MGSQAFQTELVECRAVLVPDELEGALRDRFVDGIRRAAALQAEAAERGVGVLRITGDVFEDPDNPGRLLIPHEPAAPADPAVIADGLDPPADIGTLWWLTWTLLSGLEAAEAVKLVHGGIQLATLVVDATGQVKLTDFGIAPTFLMLLGPDVRATLACEVQPAGFGGVRPLSAIWGLQPPTAALDHGWIAPYCANELLSGEAQSDRRTDQFALGTVLYLWATGATPLGQPLSDPSLMMHFMFEPTPLVDYREDWKEVFERRDADHTLEADRPIIAISDTLQQLLRDIPSERFETFADAVKAATPFIHETWQAAANDLHAASGQLAALEYENAVSTLDKWRQDESLPTIWRERIERQFAIADAGKQEAAQRRELRALVDQAVDLLETGSYAPARDVLERVTSDPLVEDQLRGRAEELLAQCQEGEAELTMRAVEVSQTYLDAAREAMTTGDFEQCRTILESLKADPNTPAPTQEAADELLAELAQAETDWREIESQIAAAEQAFAAHDLDGAEAALTRARTVPTGTEAFTGQLAALDEQLARLRVEREALVADLDDCARMLEACEVEALIAKLDAIPEDLPYVALQTRRAELAGQASDLRALYAQCGHVQTLIDNQQFAEAHRELTRLRGKALPAPLAERVAALDAECQRLMAEHEAELRADAEQGWRDALALWQAGHVSEFLSTAPAYGAHPLLDEQTCAEATRLLELADQVAAARQQAETAITADRFDEAAAALAPLAGLDLPEPVQTKIAEKQEQITAARQAEADRKTAAFQQGLRSAQTALDGGDLDAALAALRALQSADEIAAADRDTAESLRAEAERQRKLRDAYEKIAHAGEGGDLAAVSAELSAFRTKHEAELPSWLSERAQMLSLDLQARLDEARRARQEALKAALGQAATAIAQDDAATARMQLKSASGLLDADDSDGARARITELTQEAEAIDAWLPRIAATRERLSRGELLVAQSDAAALRDAAEAPARFQQQGATLLAEIEQAIVHRRNELANALQTLAGEVEQKGRRVRRLQPRLAEVTSDALATDAHQQQAAAIAQAWEAAPQPSSPVALIGGIAATVVVAAFGGWFLFSGSGGPNEPNTPQPPPQTAYVDATKSSAAASPAVVSAADGESIAVRATLVNPAGEPVADAPVVLQLSGVGQDAINGLAAAQTTADGVTTFELSSTAAARVEALAIVTAPDGEETSIQVRPTTLRFLGPADPGQSRVEAAKREAQADGADTIAVSVTLRDAAGNELGDSPVALRFSGDGAGVIKLDQDGAGIRATSMDGRVAYRLSSTAGGRVDVDVLAGEPGAEVALLNEPLAMQFIAMAPPNNNETPEPPELTPAELAAQRLAARSPADASIADARQLVTTADQQILAQLDLLRGWGDVEGDPSSLVFDADNDWEIDAVDATLIARDGRLTLAAAGDIEPAVLDVRETATWQGDDNGDWRVQLTWADAEAVRDKLATLEENLAGAARSAVRRLGDDGALRQAHTHLAELAAAFPDLPPASAEYGLPPRWRTPDGFTEPAWDPQTDRYGYPPRLQSAAGEVLQRVVVEPGDELWNSAAWRDAAARFGLSAQAIQPGWRIFYIAASGDRSAPVSAVTFAQAQQAVAARSLSAARIDEWLLSVADDQLAGDADAWRGPGWWCAAPDGSEPWLVARGAVFAKYARLLEQANAGAELAPPAADAPFAQVAGWLGGDLVCARGGAAPGGGRTLAVWRPF